MWPSCWPGLMGSCPGGGLDAGCLGLGRCVLRAPALDSAGGSQMARAFDDTRQLSYVMGGYGCAAYLLLFLQEKAYDCLKSSGNDSFIFIYRSSI